MSRWEQFIQDAIKLLMFLAAAYGVVWKALDTFEKIKKERSVGFQKIDEIRKVVDENRRMIEHANECCEKNSEEIIGIKAKASEMMTIVLSYFKK